VHGLSVASGSASPRPEQVRYRAIRVVLFVVLAIDVVMAVSKGIYGYLTGSLGMFSDGLHSALHAAGGVLGVVGVSLAARPPDARHPYGYERYEPLAAMGIAVVMLAAVWEIIRAALARFETPAVRHVELGSFAIMIAAMVATVARATWERAKARALASSILRADAARAWSELLVSASVLAGLVAIRVGLPAVDTMVSLVVAVVIASSAWRIVRGASRVLTDAAIGDAEQIAAIVRGVDGVRDCHQVRARGVGGMVRVDLHMTVDPAMSVAKSHELIDEVERQVRDQLGGVAEVLVHVGAATRHRTAP